MFLELPKEVLTKKRKRKPFNLFFSETITVNYCLCVALLVPVPEKRVVLVGG